MEGSSGHIVTKAVLLDWLSSALGTHYYSLEQLQSGAAYVRAFAHVFSSHVDLVEVQWVEHPRTADDIDKNMEVLESTLSSLGIPPVLDPDGIRNAQYPAHYDLLVLLYFVYKMTLAESPGSFDATLARPVTPELADFLRSYELPQVVSKTGAWLCVRGDTTVTTQKAPQQELPAIGSVMQAHGMQHTTELNGQAGKFLGASDGHPQRFLVQFPQPHGCVLVFPENVRVMSGPRRAPVVDSLVRILATGSTLDFCTGHVTGYKDTTDGLMCFVDTDAQGVVLLEVDCLEEIVTIHDDDAVDFPAVAVGAGGGGGGTGGTGGGGGGGGRADVAELEKLQMENSLLRAALTAANCARDGQSQGLSSHATRMKAIHEREMATVKNTYETKIETLKAGFARDLTAQTEHIQTQYAEVWADLQHMNTAFREKTWPWLNSSMYSHAPNDELIAQSAALEKLFPNKMIEMLEETNASLSECAQRQETRANEAERRLHNSTTKCTALLRALLQSNEEADTLTASDTSPQQHSPLLPLLSGRGLTPQQDADLHVTLADYLQSGANRAETINDILALAVRITDLTEENKILSHERHMALGQARLAFVDSPRGQSQRGPPSLTELNISIPDEEVRSRLSDVRSLRDDESRSGSLPSENVMVDEARRHILASIASGPPAAKRVFGDDLPAVRPTPLPPLTGDLLRDVDTVKGHLASNRLTGAPRLSRLG